MGRIWVLDTETKGTGAEMIPLEKALRKDAPAKRSFLGPARPEPRPEAPPAPPPPRRFRVADVMSGRLLVEDGSARETVDRLKDVRSVVDVNVSVFEPEDESWRLLTLREQRALWALRDR